VNHRTSRASERGVVLVVGLILLLVLTLYGVTAMRSMVLEERMTGNTQDAQVAFQMAEAALREAELLLQQASLPAFDDNNGLYTFQPPTAAVPTPLWERDTTVWRAATVESGAPAPLQQARAEFLIEQILVLGTVGAGGSLQADAEINVRQQIVYRITARAWGVAGAGNPAPMAVLQSTFLRQ
jgi:type IV pilus assembly protein PilX